MLFEPALFQLRSILVRLYVLAVKSVGGFGMYWFLVVNIYVAFVQSYPSVTLTCHVISVLYGSGVFRFSDLLQSVALNASVFEIYVPCIVQLNVSPSGSVIVTFTVA